jgi:hypothetical protein
MFLKLFISKTPGRIRSLLFWCVHSSKEKMPTGAHPEDLNVHVRWVGKINKHPNYFHHGSFMVPLVASTFGHLLPGF